jgi:hypothetical protein
MTERKWAPTHGQGSFSDKSEYEAYLDGYCESIAKTAAPDLYEALKAALDGLIFSAAEIKAHACIPEEDTEMLQERIDRARAALAKSRGE